MEFTLLAHEKASPESYILETIAKMTNTPLHSKKTPNSSVSDEIFGELPYFILNNHIFTRQNAARFLTECTTINSFLDEKQKKAVDWLTHQIQRLWLIKLREEASPDELRFLEKHMCLGNRTEMHIQRQAILDTIKGKLQSGTKYLYSAWQVSSADLWAYAVMRELDLVSEEFKDYLKRMEALLEDSEVYAHVSIDAEATKEENLKETFYQRPATLTEGKLRADRELKYFKETSSKKLVRLGISLALAGWFYHLNSQ